ncbi:MAG: bifunctional oligoribonuclease/PAP phosphatase NrnA [Actinomycetota bacterium]|nr:bifunctional oligoribonuclease/PAP phosphatase NrnA [Actinomycetota bacterium]
MKTLDEVVAVIADARDIGLVSHINPDGDSIGSLLGLAITLNDAGKRVFASLPLPEHYPPQYRFLPGRDLLNTPQEIPGGLEVFMALDCSNLDRLGELCETAEAAETLINIDHHEDNQLFGSINLVDDGASSTAELIHRLLKRAGWSITPDVATCLYTGLVTDTGRFQHRNTAPRTFMTASELAGEGADIHRVVMEIYHNQSLSYTRLIGVALQRTEVVEDCGLVYSYITMEDLKRTGAILPETEDLIDFLRGIKGTSVVALFKEMKEGKTRVSLRSRDGNEVGPIARSMGGGGHAMAAGYTSERDIKESIRDLVDILQGEWSGD